MAIPHVASGQIADIGPLGAKLRDSTTTTLVKTDKIEVIRLVVPAGKEIRQHHVPGEITVQCLEGRVDISAQGESRILRAGQLLFLSGGAAHTVKGLEDSSVLLTILLEHKV